MTRLDPRRKRTMKGLSVYISTVLLFRGDVRERGPCPGDGRLLRRASRAAAGGIPSPTEPQSGSGARLQDPSDLPAHMTARTAGPRTSTIAWTASRQMDQSCRRPSALPALSPGEIMRVRFWAWDRLWMACTIAVSSFISQRRLHWDVAVRVLPEQWTLRPQRRTRLEAIRSSSDSR